MKNMITTTGKKTHTLVKENTPCCHKIRQECVSLKRSHFSTYHCVFFPTVVQKLVGRLDSCFPTHTKKYMTPTHALIFKNMSKCVFVLDILKSWCKLITLWGSTCSKKRLAGRSFFQNIGLQCPGRVSPSRSSRAAPSSCFFMFFEA